MESHIFQIKVYNYSLKAKKSDKLSKMSTLLLMFDSNLNKFRGQIEVTSNDRIIFSCKKFSSVFNVFVFNVVRKVNVVTHQIRFRLLFERVPDVENVVPCELKKR